MEFDTELIDLNYVDELIKLGIIQNRELFIDYLKKEYLTFAKATVRASGKHGGMEEVYLDDEDLFKCHLCNCYSNWNYSSCKHLFCHNCSFSPLHSNPCSQPDSDDE